MSFGYSASFAATSQVVSANTDNGFYQADVRIDGADAASIKPAIDVEDLKAIAKDIKNYQNGINFKSLASTLLTSMNSVLPSTALYVTWEDIYGKRTRTTSEYKLAVTAVKPLSYNFANEISDTFLPSHSMR